MQQISNLKEPYGSNLLTVTWQPEIFCAGGWLDLQGGLILFQY